jgi:hypothetical protein
VHFQNALDDTRGTAREAGEADNNEPQERGGERPQVEQDL